MQNHMKDNFKVIVGIASFSYIVVLNTSSHCYSDEPGYFYYNIYMYIYTLHLTQQK